MQKGKPTKNKGQPIASGSGVKLPKLPKMQKPEEYKIRSRPMFSLAEEVLRLPKPIPKAEKERLAKQQEIAPRRRRSSVMESFTAMRKSREEFREKLMKLIRQSGPGEDGDSIPSGEERNLLRYYYYLRYGIDSTHVAPLDPEIIKRVHGLISRKLRKWTETLAKGTEEMREDFMMSMKTAIVDFVLKDPNTEESPIVEQTPVQIELGEMKDDAWRNRYVIANKFILKNLHLYNPCIAQVLKIWWNKYIGMRLIAIADMCRSSNPFDMVGFNAMCNYLVLNSGFDLVNDWIPTILEVFQQGLKRRQLPDPKNIQKVKHFYNCLAAIMTYQLQTLCNNSMIEFTDLMLDVGGKNRGFNINVVYQNEAIDFEPPFKAFKDKICIVLDYMMEACKKCPRIETLLYKDLIITSRATLRPLIEKKLVEELKRKICDMIDEQRIGPELRIQDFDDYLCLLDGSSQEQVDEFLNAEPEKTFEEYCAESVKYVELSKEIANKLEPTVYSGLFCMLRCDLIQMIRGSAIRMGNMLLRRMTEDYQVVIKEIFDEYAGIAEKLLTPPPNTQGLMELIAYCEKVEEVIMYEMEDKLRDVMRYILFLADYTNMTPLELKANNQTFHWYAKTPIIIQECKEMCEQKKEEFKELLKVRIAKFIKDLDVYALQANELQYWGNIEELEKYVIRSRRLDEKLSNALTTIDQFNEEEAAFEWEISQYPKRKQIYDKLVPFKKLYDAAHDYLEKFNKWMSHRVGSFDPEDIETDVGYYYKIVYKLEKSFGEVPEARRLANSVREKIEDFKSHMGIVLTLGNPGLKARHWDQISDIVGFPIPVDDDLTLQKVIDYMLDDYVSKFEPISEAATKENNLEKMLDKMMREWADLDFEILVYKDTGTYILSSIDDIQLQLDDHIVKTQTMKNSPYIKPFEDIIIDWEAKLLLLQEILDEWLKVQATWMYLEPIFSSPDIQQQIPEEGRRFAAVDKTWREIMKEAFIEPRVLDVITIERMLERMKKSNNLLDMVQRGLNAYLEKKRLYFPRFFFLSNDELLEILSETKDPTR